MSKAHHAKLAMRAAKFVATSKRKRQTIQTLLRHLRESI